MRLNPRPTPQAPELTVAVLHDEVEDYLTSYGTYTNEMNRRKASENLTYAALRIMRGADLKQSSSTCLLTVRSDQAARRLRRAAAMFESLAERLEG
jgi:hypothetical protein